jgi:parallel beta-helix repeat protein
MGPIYLNVSVVVLGEYTESTIIQGAAAGNLSMVSALVHVQADNCTFLGFTLLGDEDVSDLIGLDVISSNNTFSDNVFSLFNKGISFSGGVRQNNVSGNVFSDNHYGIYSRQASDGMVSGNTFTDQSYVGAYLSISDRTTVRGNVFQFNDMGLRIKSTEESVVYQNVFTGNDEGLWLCCGAANNLIFENNFYETAEWHARDDIYNQWDNGEQGNYWDDYSEKFPNATALNGVWDTSYQISGPYKENEEDLSVDRYPLVVPYDI